MKSWLVVTAFGSSLVACGAISASAEPVAFTDTMCPQANSPVREYNRLNVNGIAEPGLLDPARAVAGAYGDCVRSFDKVTSGDAEAHQSDFVAVERMYSRVQLARSFVRIGLLAADANEPSEAREAFRSARIPLLQNENLVPQADLTSAGSEGRLLAEGRAILSQIGDSESQLPKA